MSEAMLSYLRSNRDFEIAYHICLDFVRDWINEYVDTLELDPDCNCDWWFPISLDNYYAIGLDKKTCKIWVYYDVENAFYE